MNSSASEHDVVIVGGGLAGLTLALQLKQRFAELDILVLERRRHPVAEAAHKVGESSVEIGAHYFAEVLGLRDHLEAAQLRKFGFRFFFSDGRRDIDRVTEIGPSRPLAVPSWQIDRGIFENFLAQEAARRGVRFLDGAVVRGIDLAAEEDAAPRHRVRFERPGAEGTASARWLVDASGRAGLLKRKLGLAKPNGHDPHAVWFRVRHRIEIDRWSDDPAWQARCTPPERWRSTNHLCGPGYWVWLIPLASGSHSVGIVADPALHAFESINTFERAMDWLEVHQPRLFDELEPRRDALQDFAFLRHFSYGCGQVFSGARWALTGEAGLFLDPFYSPGSDFIGIANTYITDLIAIDRANGPLGSRAALYDQLYHSFYANTLALYEGQYALFGDPEVLPVKVIWDYAYYWGVLAQFFFQNRLTDLAALGRLRGTLAGLGGLNRAAQNFLRAWSAVGARRNPAVMLDQAAIPWFVELNRSLEDRLDDAAFIARIGASAERLCLQAEEMLMRASSDHPALDGGPLRAALADVRAASGALAGPAPARSARVARPLRAMVNDR